jgi:alkylation response protein AidB-like acyl-CoA dehydrogenase
VDLNDTPEQAQFREKVRSWLEEHKGEAPVLEGPDALTEEDEIVAARRVWQRKLAEGGLAGATWPTEYGGQGLGPIEQVIISQEIARAGVPGILDVIGVGMLGPTIIAHGTEEQKQKYLGPMLHGDEVWCQLFSEPAAGSDLAGIQSRAKEVDGGFVLNGQKVWTTNAQFSAYGLLLARTDPEQHKHKGLTMFIVPMDAEGVTVRGLRQITGDAEFNEVFFDDVKLDADAVVGGVNNGWGTALTTLMFERLTIGFGSEGMGYRPERFAARVAEDPEAARNGEVRQRLGHVATELMAVRFTGYRMLSALQQGQIPGPEAGLSKITTVNAGIQACELVADVVGPDALREDVENPFSYHTSFLPGLKSAGGTEEILRNTIGERVLGLPPEPRLDKGIPFSELRAKEKAGAAK